MTTYNTCYVTGHTGLLIWLLSLHFGTGFKDELESIKTVYEKLFVVSGDSGKLIWKAEKGDVVVKCSHLPSFSPHLTSPHLTWILLRVWS